MQCPVGTEARNSARAAGANETNRQTTSSDMSTRRSRCRYDLGATVARQQRTNCREINVSADY